MDDTKMGNEKISDSTSVDALGFTFRARSVLRIGGIHTFGQLKRMHGGHVKHLPGCGPKTSAEILEKLAELTRDKLEPVGWVLVIGVSSYNSVVGPFASEFDAREYYNTYGAGRAAKILQMESPFEKR